MRSNNKSIIEGFLYELLRPQFKYKGMSVNLFGLPVSGKSYSKRSFSNAISKMKNRELVEYEGDFFKITPRGREYIKRRQDRLNIFAGSFKKESPKNLIVMFDIPEDKKAEREWFRFHLKKFNYGMIQKSVWVGPSPLPKDFLDYLEEIKLKECIKTFKLAKPYQIKN